MIQPEWAELQFELRFTIKSWLYDAMGRHTGVPPNVDHISPPDSGLPGEVDYFDYIGPRIDEAMSLYRQHPPWGGGHDECTWVGSWFDYYRISGDKRVKEFLYFLRDGFLAWGKRNLYHGYWPRGEIHHQMETFRSWLCHYWRLNDEIDTDVRIIEDAAHHMGNWVEGIPEWYDWERHAFRSRWPGTKVVLAPGPEAYDSLEHALCIPVAIEAYRASKKERYLTLVCDWLDAWSRLILDSHEDYPVVRLPIDDPNEIRRIYGENREITAVWRYQNKIREGWESGPEQANAQLCLPSRHVGKIGTDWEACRNAYFTRRQRTTGYLVPVLEAAYREAGSELHMAAWEKMAELEEQRDPDGVPPVALAYRRFHGDTRYEEKLRGRAITAAEGAKDSPLPTILMKEFSRFGRYMPAGNTWAYRADDGGVVPMAASAGTFLAAYHHTGDRRWLKPGLEWATRTLQMANAVLRDGREHGCGSGWRIAGPGGQAIGVLCNLVRGSNGLSYYDLTHRRSGLPETMAALVKPGDGPIELSLYNNAERDVELQIEVGEGGNISALTVDGQPSAKISLRFANVLVPVKKAIRVSIEQEAG